MKRQKCSFLQPSVEYLGHVVDAQGLHTTRGKQQAMADAPTPTNLTELRSFLGLVNYYGRFISNLATRLQPLTQLLHKGESWKWTVECETAFRDIKAVLSSSQVLAHYDPSLPLSLAADASPYGVGAVISQQYSDGSERPIAYASRTLTASEKNYPQIEKEALALVFGVKRFHQYLYGRKFCLITDHKPLTTILASDQAIPSLSAARLQRWAILLSAYRYDIRFRRTQDHANADGLSRLPVSVPPGEEFSSVAACFNLAQINSLPVTAGAVATATRQDPLLSKVLLYLRQGWPASVPAELQLFSSRRLELTVESQCLLWGIRVVVPCLLYTS
ncbi:MAG: Ty3/Gypsy family RNase HI domain-containing protein, partial [Alphaproteobacteria bacterium]|nr:Ty3/Gypsy family RNase HI domain-containing protein [Alphaproteobacteria bacterium]